MQNIFSNRQRLYRVIILSLAVVGVFVIIDYRPLPNSLLLAVPFTDQAPTGKWDRNEDCEEASIAMAQAYLDGNRENQLPATVAQESISKLRAWEAANADYNADTGAYATSLMAEGAFGITVRQIKDYSARDLKKELIKGHVILLPINARLLGNPAYIESGPFYHMIVIRGYNSVGFLVNDPGVQQGNSNVYSFDILIKAAADWNNAAQIMDSTRKFALILSK